jgi:SNF2 family DNA or RNA helicase
MSNKALVVGNRIHLYTAYEFKDDCRAVPGGRWNKEQKCWTYPATPAVAGEIVARFSGKGFGGNRDFIVLAARAKDAEESRQNRNRGHDELEPIPGEKLPSWLHQLQAHHFAKGQDAAMLAVGMGGGKTKITIDLLEQGWPDVYRVLVLCPTNVLKVWPKEFAGAEPEGKVGHQHRRWEVVNGLRRNRKGKMVALPMAERVSLFHEALSRASMEHPVCICVNYEAAPQDPLAKWLLAQEWDVVALDESHRIKSPGGVQSRFCDTLRTRARRRLCMTGTMMPHSPLDIYAQYRFLEPGIFGTNYSRFRQQYAIMGGFQGKQVMGMNEATAPELSEKIAKLAYIISNEDLDKVLGLEPPVWPDWRTAPLSPKTQKAYDSLSQDLVAALEEGTIEVNNALTQLLRLQQITSGYVPVERACPKCDMDGCADCDGTGWATEIIQLGTEKRDLFADWLSDLPLREPVVVACRFTADLQAIREVCEKQGRRYGELSGRDNDGLTERATMSPDIDVLGVQIQAGGVGIDLTRAHYVANYSVGFSLGDFEQWLKRTHRPGQDHRVVYQNFVIENTVDVTVLRALAERKNVVDAVIAAAKDGAL